MLIVFLLVSLASAEQITGRVADAGTGEALARVLVQASGLEAVTESDGRFALTELAPGEHTLQISTVGYRPLKQKFTLGAGETKQFEVALHPETLRHSESITVEAGPFAREVATAVGLAGNELKNLASVLADDPLRAVQGLPGVTSNDDFQSQISLRGAGFHRIGVYLDGVLLHAPFHAVQGEASSGSLTIFNGDMLDSVNLHAGTPPASFADRTAGALDVRTRDGDRRRFSLRAAASASNAGLMAEGPLGRGRRGSWLAAARKSYLQYLIERTSDDPTLAFGFSDVQGRVHYDVAPNHNLSLSVIEGHSGFERTEMSRLGINSVATTDYHFTLIAAASRYTPSASFQVNSRAAWLRERFENRNREASALAGGGYAEWLWNADSSKVWKQSNTLDFGFSLRRVRDDGRFNRYVFNPTAIRRLDEFRGAGIRAGAYFQQSFTPLPRVQFSAGGRWDRHSVNGITAVSPHASAVFQILSATRLHLAWGQYVQFPEINQLFSMFGRRWLLPERAAHFQAALEQRIDTRTRLRLEAYSRHDRDLLFRPRFEPRILSGRVFNPPVDAPIENSQRGYGRGVQILVQRRTANSFTGWIAYAYGVARVRDGRAGVSFAADFDQRHSVNVFGSYRLRPTLNLSVKWIYGSGMPVEGFFSGRNPDFFLSDRRNQVRLPSYQRADVRINKAFVRDRWQMTLYGEVINVTGHDNIRFDVLTGYDARTGRARLNFQKMFPVLPSAGIVFEF